MKHTFYIQPLSCKSISALPGSWQESDYRQLLQAMEYDEISDSEGEVAELCLLALEDLGADTAATFVLQHLLANKLSKGQIENLSHEMQQEAMWEEYSDISLHEGLFKAGELLHNAFGSIFPQPTALVFRLNIEYKGAQALPYLKEPDILRLLMQGMPDNARLRRLFQDSAESENFPEAEHILWQYTLNDSPDSLLQLEFISSGYWFGTFKNTPPFHGILNFFSSGLTPS